MPNDLTCQHIAVEQRLAIGKLFSSDYNMRKVALQHDCSCYYHRQSRI